jgi:hypothetical protein
MKKEACFRRGRRVARDEGRGAGEYACRGMAALGLIVATVVSGCGGDARVELAAADALIAAADRMDTAVAEYHGEVSRFDDTRESAVVAAFIARVQADAGNKEAVAGHSAEFGAALRKIRADRAVEQDRKTATMENVAVVREVAAGLQRMGIDSLSLQDELKRYLSSWIEARQKAKVQAGQQAGQVKTDGGTGGQPCGQAK